MKKIYFVLVTVLLMFEFSYAQTFQIRIVNKGGGALGVEMTETSGTGTPTTSNYVVDIVFGIKWLQSYGSGLDLNSSITTNYNIKKSGSRATKGVTYYFQAFYADLTPFSIPSDWTPAGTWVEIMSISNNLGGDVATGTFEICETSFDATTDPDFGISYNGVDIDYYTPTINGQADNVPTPVELSSFSALVNQNATVSLKWQTATEVNNYGFEIERKENNNESANWEKVGFVEGSGNSNSPKDYTFVDKNITGGPKFIYRLKQIDNDGKFSYSDKVEVEVIPDKYELFQNYPNPFNPVTNFRFQIVNPGLVTLRVYDILGNEVATVINKELEAGFYKYQWNANTLASGIYFYRLSAGNYNSVMKMILMK